MSNENILKEILSNKVLQEKYWPDIDVEAQNINTLLHTNNKFLLALYYLFNENNQIRFNYMLKNIKELFEL